MKEDAPRVIKIPAKPEATRQAEARRQLRVAAYCRVSTKEEDQANSYEVQKEYYTDKIMSNTAWTMAGIFADKGITGTSAKKREDFMRMIRHCRQKKIDVILTKSVSRFSRNTVDCLYYIRALKQLGIAVIFEKKISILWRRTVSCGSPSPVPSPNLKVNPSPPMSHGVNAVPWKPERSASNIKSCLVTARVRMVSRRSFRNRRRSSDGSMSAISPEPACG